MEYIDRIETHLFFVVPAIDCVLTYHILRKHHKTGEVCAEFAVKLSWRSGEGLAVRSQQKHHQPTKRERAAVLEYHAYRKRLNKYLVKTNINHFKS